MQSAETVLGVLRERGRRGLPCNELYRQLFNPQLYLLAYGRIYSNQGAMTPGATGRPWTACRWARSDASSMRCATSATGSARSGGSTSRRRTGRLRPLGLPSWSDKLVGEVVRLLLEAYYEPPFSDRSHGFRPGRGCHTALREVANTWTGTTWFIEGDISDCFGSLDHEIMLSILAEKIHDNRFLRLMRNMLQAGYLEDWVWNATLSGAPQGGVASPILSNIYLDRLDTFVETVLIPEYTRGKRRAANPAYRQVQNGARAGPRSAATAPQARQLRQQLRSLPSQDPDDPGYRRLRYCPLRRRPPARVHRTEGRSRGDQDHAWRTFLRDDLKLELSQDKTLITHARTGAARFLGYEITVQHDDQTITAAAAVNGSDRAARAHGR